MDRSEISWHQESFYVFIILSSITYPESMQSMQMLAKLTLIEYLFILCCVFFCLNQSRYLPWYKTRLSEAWCRVLRPDTPWCSLIGDLLSQRCRTLGARYLCRNGHFSQCCKTFYGYNLVACGKKASFYSYLVVIGVFVEMRTNLWQSTLNSTIYGPQISLSSDFISLGSDLSISATGPSPHLYHNTLTSYYRIP